MLKGITILKSLEAGIPVEIGSYKYCLSEELDLCIIAKSWNTSTNKESEIYLTTDYTLGQFLRMCEELSSEEIALIGANKVLNDIK